MVSGRTVLKVALLQEDVIKLGTEGLNQIRRNAKMRGTGIKRAKTRILAAEHSFGGKKAPRMKLKNLPSVMDAHTQRREKLLRSIEEKLKDINKLMVIK